MRGAKSSAERGGARIPGRGQGELRPGMHEVLALVFSSSAIIAIKDRRRFVRWKCDVILKRLARIYDGVHYLIPTASRRGVCSVVMEVDRGFCHHDIPAGVWGRNSHFRWRCRRIVGQVDDEMVSRTNM